MWERVYEAFIRLRYLNAFPPGLFLILLGLYAYNAFRWRRFILYTLPLHISINLYFRVTDSVTLNMVELLAILASAAWVARSLWPAIRQQGLWSALRAQVLDSPLSLALLIYMLSYLALLFNAPLGEETVKGLVRSAEIGMLFFALRDAIRSRGDVAAVLGTLLASSLFVGALTWYQRWFIPDLISYYRHVATLIDLWLLPKVPWWYEGFVGLSPVVRVGGNIDPSGLSTSIYLPPVILLALLAAWWAEGEVRARLWAKRAALLALAGLLGGALFFTLSRSGIYAFAGALGLVAFLLKPKYVLYLAAAGLVVVALASQFTENYAIARVLSQSSDALSSLSGRPVLLLRSWEIVKTSPWIGAGMSSFGTGEGQSYPHNQYMAVWQARGVAAFLSLLAVFALAAWRAWQSYRTATDRFARGVLIWCLGAMAAYALHGLAHTPLDEIQIGAIFWLALAVAEALRRQALAVPSTA